MSNAHSTEIPFLEAIASMTDAELAAYGRRYATATDSISVMHGNAVRAEMGRRAKAALAPQPTAAELLPARGEWSTAAEDYAHGVAIRAILDTTHYNYGGNAYYGIPASGFCGAKAGMFTFDKAEVNCDGCLDELRAIAEFCAK